MIPSALCCIRDKIFDTVKKSQIKLVTKYVIESANIKYNTLACSTLFFLNKEFIFKESKDQITKIPTKI